MNNKPVSLKFEQILALQKRLEELEGTKTLALNISAVPNADALLDNVRAGVTEYSDHILACIEFILGISYRWKLDAFTPALPPVRQLKPTVKIAPPEPLKTISEVCIEAEQANDMKTLNELWNYVKGNVSVYSAIEFDFMRETIEGAATALGQRHTLELLGQFGYKGQKPQ